MKDKFIIIIYFILYQYGLLSHKRENAHGTLTRFGLTNTKIDRQLTILTGEEIDHRFLFKMVSSF